MLYSFLAVWKPSTDAVNSGMNYLGGPNSENTEFLKHCKWIHLVVTHPLCILSKYYSIRHTTYLPISKNLQSVSLNQKSNQIIWKDYISYMCCNLDRIWCRVQWAKNCAFIRYYIQIVTQVWYVIFPDVLIIIFIKWDN